MNILRKFFSTTMGEREILTIKGAASGVAAAIAEQKKRHEEYNCSNDIAFDLCKRKAVDDFAVGYAIGMATILLQARNIDVKRCWKTFLGELWGCLNPIFPGIDVDGCWQKQSLRLRCGYLLGCCEPSNDMEPRVLADALDNASSHAIGGGSWVYQYACTKFRGINHKDAELIIGGIEEIKDVYCDMMQFAR